TLQRLSDGHRRRGVTQLHCHTVTLRTSGASQSAHRARGLHEMHHELREDLGGAAPGGRADPADSPRRTLGARPGYSNPWLSAVEYAVVRPDGQPGIYGVVDPGPNATIVALDDHEHVTLVRDFVYPLQRAAWGLPSGKVEEGEAPLAAAQRELAEEAALAA